ncbi:hypothetical protein MXB_367 [Myxobolus squamalis]|nr:hypothetical protein MXB_367 [Myxobolus squamalis]
MKILASLSQENLAILRLVHILLHARVGTLISLLFQDNLGLKPLKILHISSHLGRRTSRALAHSNTLHSELSEQIRLCLDVNH